MNKNETFTMTVEEMKSIGEHIFEAAQAMYMANEILNDLVDRLFLILHREKANVKTSDKDAGDEEKKEELSCDNCPYPCPENPAYNWEEDEEAAAVSLLKGIYSALSEKYKSGE